MPKPKPAQKPVEELTYEEALAELEAKFKEGWFDLPLWVAARHTFEEYNHEWVRKRVKKSQAMDA